jgi:hypothetical protein
MQMMQRLFFLSYPYPHLGLSTAAWTLMVHRRIPWSHVSSNTTMDCHCLLTMMDCRYLLTRITWHGLGQPGLAQTPMLPSVALLYWPLWPSSLQT